MFIVAVHNGNQVFAEISVAQSFGEDPREVFLVQEVNGGEVIVYKANLDEVTDIKPEMLER